MRSSSASQRLADFKSGLLCIKDLVEEKVFDLKRLLLRQMSIARTDRIDRIKEISVRRKTRNHKLIPFFVYSCQKYLKIQRMTLLREAFADVLMKSLNNDRTKQNNALLGSKSSRRDNEKGMQEVRQNLKDKFDNLRKNGHKENETNEAGLSRNLSTNNICRKTRGRSQSSKSLVKNKSQANIVGRAAKTPTRSNLSKLAEDEDATLQEKLKKPKIKMISRDKSVSLLNSQKDAHGIVNEGQQSDEASVNNINFGLNRSFGLQAPSAQSKASEKNHSMLADSGKKQAKGLKKPEAKRQSVKLDKGLLLLNTLFSRKIRSHRNNLVQGMKRAAEHKLKRIAALSKRKNFLSFEKALMIVKMGHLEYSFAGLKQFQKSEKPNQEWKAMIRRVLRKEVIESLLGCWSLRIEGLNKVRQLMAEKELHTKQLVINSIRLKGKQATTKYILYLNDFLSLLIKRKALGPAFYFLKFDHPRISPEQWQGRQLLLYENQQTGKNQADRQLLFFLPPAETN
jgi:hypothetical protein